MATIVLGNKAKIDNRTTLHHIQNCDVITDITHNHDVVNLLESTEENIKLVTIDDHQLYIPSTLLADFANAKASIHVYFDLENYPFYQSAKAIIEQRTDRKKTKGVFRFRRMVQQSDNDQTLIADLYVIFSMLGWPIDCNVRRTNQEKTPAHTILLLNFGNGTIAHIEYTISDQNRIGMEWSGIKSIIEFDSNEMNPFDPINKTKLPLMYAVDSIIQTAIQLDDDVIKQLNAINQMISGGTQK